MEERPKVVDTLTDAHRLIAETPFPSARTTREPYPYYAALRENAPIYRLPTGEYVLSRHADVLHVTRHPEIFSSRHCLFEDGRLRAATPADLQDDKRPWGIVTSDEPVHAVKRRLAMEMFKPSRLKERAELIARFADELIDGFIDRGECEFVSEFARLLPGKVIMTCLGLPLSDLPRALEWAHYEGFGTRFASPAHQDAAQKSVQDMSRYAYEQILARADHPGDDDLSRLVQRHKAEFGKLDMPNLIADGMNLFNGGFITTAHLLANMMMLFIRHPDQQAKARASRDTLANAVEESLRMDAPVQLSLRLVLEDTQINGVPVAAGQFVVILWGSGNYDPEVFEDPERFDVERRNSKDHLSFGGGSHFCLGAPLGRLEVRIAYEHIFARLKNLRFAPDRNDFANQDAVIFRGPERLHIQFDRA